jgi:hypothetical protein
MLWYYDDCPLRCDAVWSGNYMYHMTWKCVNMSRKGKTKHIYGFCVILTINRDYFPKSSKRLRFSMEKQGVSCAVGTELLALFRRISWSLSKCWDGSQVPSCYCVPLCSPPDLNSSIAVKDTNIIFSKLYVDTRRILSFKLAAAVHET